MRFFADLHIHSKYSRATSRDADLERLALWARKKGIGVLGTGDFTHPAWIAEITGKTVPAEPGLLRLRPDLEREVSAGLQALGMTSGLGEAVRFLLTVEISTIYKKGERTRKVHHLICVPSLEAARRLNLRLARVGNIASDGRPILGLDSRDLLEITLEADPAAFLVPAHIWTPWFSALGSKSGFDSIQECYGDLAGHIFALETGLSSDPPMNWRVSSLDDYRLISNSDAHSPAKLGREATIFDTELSYFALRHALESGTGFAGTVEFFPEEGKYHLDGHRTCQVCLQPAETLRRAGSCPVCGKPLTVGVLNRVEVLADRLEGARSPKAAPFLSFVPLQEIVAEIEGVGQGSNRVSRGYEAMLRALGPELFILESVPLEEIQRQVSLKMAEAIGRVRRGEVIRQGGYDGEYGVIRVFTPSKGVSSPPRPRPPVVGAPPVEAGVERSSSPDGGEGLDPEQTSAAHHDGGPLLILAGPGTGKTRTLTHRLARVITLGAPPEACLAVTFTRRAAQEMRERLALLLGEAISRRIPVMTFHALGWSIVQAHDPLTIADETRVLECLREELGLSRVEGLKRMRLFSRLRRGGEPALPEDEAALRDYRVLLRRRGLVDLEDLIRLPVELMARQPAIQAALRARYRQVFVDEFQDIDAGQYALLRLLVPPEGQLCVIGDPDQAIYGFRGGDPRFFQELLRDYPGLATVRLTRNYRSGRAIVQGALNVMDQAAWQRERGLTAVVNDTRRIVLHEAASDTSEAAFVVRTLEQMMGGHDFHALDSGRADGQAAGAFSFADFAVLYRADGNTLALCQAFERAGIPYQKRTHGRLSEHPGVRSLLERMGEEGRGGGPVLDRLRQAVPEGHDEMGSALELLAPLAVRFGEDLAGFLAALTLGAEMDLWDPRAQRVSLLTMHGSKGLEFPVVFVTGCEDGMVPWRWGEEGEASLEEERRLFFVAMTRARHTLFLTRAKKRLWRGQVRTMALSPFLQEIREELLERRQNARTPVASKKAAAAGRQLTMSWDE
ncbi:MAG: UvrD-helicase domain-containing protein [Magnetococcales bacterium]|nr:UvrD-helicase domain-containing protein [Magnetococcales bacterium]